MKINGSLLDFKKMKLGHQEAQFGNEISNLATMIPASVMTPSNLHVGDCSSRLFKCSNLYCKCFLLSGSQLTVS